MKLYAYAPAPNPRRLALFMSRKGIEIETQQVDLMKAEQLGDEYRAINPECTVPALVLDDGTVLTEVIGMYAYLEALYPEKPMMGTSPEEKAQIMSWVHRITMGMTLSIAGILRNKSEAFQNRALPGSIDVPQIPELVERGKLMLPHMLKKCDAQLEGRNWLASDSPSIADIDLLVSTDFMGWVKHPIPEECNHLKAWYERASAELT